MSQIKLEPVYFNSDLEIKTFKYLKNQRYLKFKEISKFIYNHFLNDYPFGFIIIDENKNIFGFLGTMFSSRETGNQSYIFCNLHTWIINENKRYQFFLEGENLLNLIFNYKVPFFAKPVKGLIRLFKRHYKMEVLNMKYRISLLLKLRNIINEKNFEIIEKENEILEKLNNHNIKIFKDHKNMTCYKFIISNKKQADDNTFVIAIKKRKKFIFNVLELIYVSDTKFFKDNWKNFAFSMCKKFKIIFCGNNYLKQEDCFIPDDQKIFKDVESQVVVKDLPKNFKFNTLYSEFVY